MASESDSGIMAFERKSEDDAALVVINVHPKQSSQTSFEGTDMTVGFPAGTHLTDLLGTLAEPVVVSAAQTVKVSLPAYGTAILVAE